MTVKRTRGRSYSQPKEEKKDKKVKTEESKRPIPVPAGVSKLSGRIISKPEVSFSPDPTAPSSRGRTKQSSSVNEDGNDLLAKLVPADSDEDESSSLSSLSSEDQDSALGNDDVHDDMIWEDVDIDRESKSPMHDQNERAESKEIKVDLSSPRPGEKDRPKKKGGPNSVQRITKDQRLLRANIHLLHLQSLVAFGYFRNRMLNDPQLQALLKSSIISDGVRSQIRKYHRLPVEKKTTKEFAKILLYLQETFHKIFKVTAPGLRRFGYCEDPSEGMMNRLESEAGKIEALTDKASFLHAAKKLRGSRDTAVELFTAFLRGLRFQARLVFSLQPLGFSFIPDEDFRLVDDGETQPKPSKKMSKSSSSSSSVTAKEIDCDLVYPIFWTEVLDPVTCEYFPIDIVGGAGPLFDKDRVKTVLEISTRQTSGQRMTHVIAYNNDTSAKDISAKYIEKIFDNPRFSDRPPPSLQSDLPINFFQNVMRLYKRKPHGEELADKADKLEDEKLEKLKTDSLSSIPTTLSKYKNHPVYILESDIHKNQALITDAVVAHEFQRKIKTGKTTNASIKEKVYFRKDLRLCKDSRNWIKLGRSIKPGEKPARVEASRHSTIAGARKAEAYKRDNQEQMLVELYTYSQTEPYVPPLAINGILPKNEYGNIDVYTPSMLPKGTVHLKQPRIAEVARKIGIDYVPVVTGFKFKSSRSYPIIEGIIVFEKYMDILVDAWLEQVSHEIQTDTQDRVKESLKRWKEYAHKLTLWQRIQEEYGEQEEEGDDSNQEPIDVDSS